MISNKKIIDALIFYLKSQAPVCFFLLSVDGTVIENNLHAEDVLGCSLVGKNIKDLIVDFFDDFDVQNLPCQGCVEKLVNLSAKDGRPRSYYFSNSHYVPKRAILNGIEVFTGSIGGSVTHICVAFSARRAPASCFLGLLGSFRAH